MRWAIDPSPWATSIGYYPVNFAGIHDVRTTNTKSLKNQVVETTRVMMIDTLMKKNLMFLNTSPKTKAGYVV